MICPKCRNEKLFTYTTKKIVCGNCGNLIDYQNVKSERHHDGEFYNIKESVE